MATRPHVHVIGQYDFCMFISEKVIVCAARKPAASAQPHYDSVFCARYDLKLYQLCEVAVYEVETYKHLLNEICIWSFADTASASKHT